jgi:hypothetical protein
MSLQRTLTPLSKTIQIRASIEVSDHRNVLSQLCQDFDAESYYEDEAESTLETYLDMLYNVRRITKRSAKLAREGVQ